MAEGELPHLFELFCFTPERAAGLGLAGQLQDCGTT